MIHNLNTCIDNYLNYGITMERWSAMHTGLSEKVRQLAVKEYVEPARRKGANVVIPVGEIQQKLRREGFPSGHIRQICTSLESKLFSDRFVLKLAIPARN